MFSRSSKSNKLPLALLFLTNQQFLGIKFILTAYKIAKNSFWILLIQSLYYTKFVLHTKLYYIQSCITYKVCITNLLWCNKMGVTNFSFKFLPENQMIFNIQPVKYWSVKNAEKANEIKILVYTRLMSISLNSHTYCYP